MKIKAKEKASVISFPIPVSKKILLRKLAINANTSMADVIRQLIDVALQEVKE